MAHLYGTNGNSYGCSKIMQKSLHDRVSTLVSSSVAEPLLFCAFIISSSFVNAVKTVYDALKHIQMGGGVRP